MRRRSVRYFLSLWYGYEELPEGKEVEARVASQVELADFLGLHYSTISRLVNAVDKNQA